MHLLVLLLLAIPLVAGELRPAALLPPPVTLAIAVGGPLLILAAAGALARAARRDLAAGRALRVHRRERLLRRLQLALLLPHAAACLLGGLVALVRRVTGDLILVDEVIVLLPPLAALVGAWWLWAPVESRLRQHDALLRGAAGLAVGPLPRPRSLVSQHVRGQLLLVLVPALAALTLVELAQTLLASRASPVVMHAAQLLGVTLVLVLSPFIVRFVVGAVPLPGGALRGALDEVGRLHGVRLGNILVWPTGLTMHNAAVVGVVPGTRYVLMTDALIEDLAPTQIVAIMAHEVAHVRHRHTVVAGVVLVGAAALLGVLLEAVVGMLPGLSAALERPRLAVWVDGGAVLLVGTVLLALFGWVSRRLERQADTFAARHLSEVGQERRDTFSPESVRTVCDALDAVACLGGIDVARPSWRHGSIAWRQAHLRGLEGRPLRPLRVDRQVRWITLASLAALAVAIIVDSSA